jgi:hypothetical protein
MLTQHQNTYHEYIKLYKTDADPKILQMTKYDPSKATKDEATVLKELSPYLKF